MSRKDDPLFYRLVDEFEEEDSDDWVDEEVGEFVVAAFPKTFPAEKDAEAYEDRTRTGLMALGHVIMLPREERDTLWAKFQLEREQ